MGWRPRRFRVMLSGYGPRKAVQFHISSLRNKAFDGREGRRGEEYLKTASDSMRNSVFVG